MKDFFNQWSTVRGVISLVAMAFGVNEPVLSAGLAVVDQLPNLALGVMGTVELVRNGKNEPVIEAE